jgi:hypothetical protein
MDFQLRCGRRLLELLRLLLELLLRRPLVLVLLHPLLVLLPHPLLVPRLQEQSLVRKLVR